MIFAHPANRRIGCSCANRLLLCTSWLISVHLSCRWCQNFKLSQQSQSVTFHAAFVYSHIEFRRSPSSIRFQVLQKLWIQSFSPSPIGEDRRIKWWLIMYWRTTLCTQKYSFRLTLDGNTKEKKDNNLTQSFKPPRWVTHRPFLMIGVFLFQKNDVSALTADRNSSWND